MPTSSYLSRAESWAASLWDASRSRWPEREGQDRNYRLHVVHPAVRDVLRRHFPEGNIHLLDLGCGDGAFLDDPENRHLLLGGVYLGVDISEELAATARNRHRDTWVSFISGNLTDRATANRILRTGAGWNCALSVFMIQELPNLDSFLATLGAVMQPGGIAVAVTVHPDFASWLRDAGHMPVAEELEEGVPGGMANWRWAGYYPIVDEPREPFHLPYFHREENEYIESFRRAGFSVREMRGIPPAADLIRLREQGVSPFVPFPTNVYWPRMAEGPSALMIVAERRCNHE